MVVSCENFNVDNIKFGEPRNVKTSFGNCKIIPIFYVQEGKEEKLVMITDKCFSWGVQEDNFSNSLKFPIVLVNKDVETSTLHPTEMQTSFLDATRKIVEECKAHCLAEKEAIGRFDLERGDLRRLGNFVYVKKEKGEVVKDFAPTLYTRVRYNQKSKKLITQFRKRNGKDMFTLEELIRQRCNLKAAICFEGIFVNNSTVSLQVKVDEAIVEPIEKEEETEESVISVEVEEW